MPFEGDDTGAGVGVGAADVDIDFAMTRSLNVQDVAIASRRWWA